MGMTRRAALFSFAGVVVLGLFIAGNVGRSLLAELALDRSTYDVNGPIGFTLTVCSNSVLPMTTEDGKPSWGSAPIPTRWWPTAVTICSPSKSRT
jgi:hypothetical protein